MEQDQSINKDLSVLLPGHPSFGLLSQKSIACSFPLSEEDKKLIEDMKQLLIDRVGDALGLAAVQVGHLKRIFILAYHNKPLVFINPKIIGKMNGRKSSIEGCLSLPGVFLRIKRYKSVIVEYYNLDGTLEKQVFEGQWARCIQHEMDHLNGILITDLGE